MNRHAPSSDLASNVDRHTLQGLQDGLAALARVSVRILDENNRPVTDPSPTAPLCAMFKCGVDSGAPVCNVLAGNDAEPTSTLCLAGCAMHTAPVRSDGRVLGSVVLSGLPDPPSARQAMEDVGAGLNLNAADRAAVAGELDRWPPARRRAVLRFADLLADVIARLYGQGRSLHDRGRELDTVYDLVRMSAGTGDLQEILDATTIRVCETMMVKACGIRLIKEETGELVIAAVHNLSEEYLNKGRILVGENVIDAAAIAGEVVYVEDAPSDPRIRFREQARREGLVSGLCAPMTYRGQTIGVIRVYTGQRHVFSRFEESMLRSIGSQTAAAIVHHRLYAARAEADRFQRQVRYAGEIQRRMIPETAPRRAGLELGSVYAPTLEVGGDFFDFIELPGGGLGLGIADVVGKGVPAALLMASARSALRAHAHSINDIAQLIAEVNRHMCRDTLAHEFATLLYGVFAADDRRFVYCNAGHNPPILLRGQDVRHLETGGLVIGVDAQASFDQEEIELLPDDVLLFYTDGVTDALNFDGEAFGHDRLCGSLFAHRDLDAATYARQILWDVRRFAGLAEQTDDITVVVAKVR